MAHVYSLADSDIYPVPDIHAVADSHGRADVHAVSDIYALAHVYTDTCSYCHGSAYPDPDCDPANGDAGSDCHCRTDPDRDPANGNAGTDSYGSTNSNPNADAEFRRPALEL